MKATNIGWRCPNNNAGEGFGFNESGMEHFAGDPFSAIAREITQNTNDAGSVKPAFLQFKTIKVPKSCFPNRSEFVEILEKCRVAAGEESQKAITFFDNALRKIEEDEITFLVARDKNTTGIIGPCERGTAYHAFMKSTGTSKKADISSGGSFGIGKNAPFAISDFHTIFVHTRYEDGNGQIRQLVQGKSILISHGHKGTEFTNNAYWGDKESFGPLVDGSAELPNWVVNPFDEENQENTTGTCIFVPGFREVRNWDKIITAYIIQNFFGAVYKRELVVEVGEYSIDENTISDLFRNEEIQQAVADYPNQPEAFLDSRTYFECMSSQDTIHETSQQQHLGKTNVGILLGEGYRRKVAFIRNGMLITDNLHGLRRFPGMKPFVAVVQCQSTAGNALFKEMEPPRHDEFQPERLPTESERRKGRVALKQLSEFVRKHLAVYATNPVEEEVNLAELSGVLGTDVVGADPSKEGEVNPTGRLALVARPRAIKNRGRKMDRSRLGLGGGFESSGDGGDLDQNGAGGPKGAQPSGAGDKDGVGTGDRAGGDGDKARSNDNGEDKNLSQMSLRNVRGIILNSKSRRIFFMPPANGKLRISFERVGADSNHPLEIDSVSIGKKLDDRSVVLEVSKMVKTQLDVTFKGDFTGAVKVIANAV